MSDSDRIGWYSRGYQPHLNVPGLTQSITTHLADSMPRATLERLLDQTRDDDPARRRHLDQLLDAGHGACWLSRPAIGAPIEQTLLAHNGKLYRLLAWVVMPNHLHLLIETLPGISLPKIAKCLKGATAHKANALLGRRGTFWERDYYDRYIRDDDHFAAVVRYIEHNPVKAGLVTRPEDWPFSSAHHRR